MVHRRVFKSKWLLILPLLAVLIMAVACGDGDAPTPLVIEKEVVVEKEVVKEVVEEVLVEKEVVKEIVKEVPVVVVATPTPGPKPAAMEKLTGTLKIAVAAFQHEALDMGFSRYHRQDLCTGHMFDYLIGATAGNGELTAVSLAWPTKWDHRPRCRLVVAIQSAQGCRSGTMAFLLPPDDVAVHPISE